MINGPDASKRWEGTTAQPDDPLMSDGAAQCVSFLLVIALTLDPFPIDGRGNRREGWAEGKVRTAVGKRWHGIGC